MNDASFSVQVPGHAMPFSIRLPVDVLDKVRDMATAQGISAGAWARSAFDAAAGKRSYAEAADSARMPLGTWMRVVIVHHADCGDLLEQLAYRMCEHG